MNEDIVRDVEELSELLNDKLGGQEALDRVTVYVEGLERTATSWGSDLEANFDRVRVQRDALRNERNELREALRSFLDWEENTLALTDPTDGTLGSQMTPEESIALENHMLKLRAVLERTEEEVVPLNNRP